MRFLCCEKSNTIHQLQEISKEQSLIIILSWCRECLCFCVSTSEKYTWGDFQKCCIIGFKNDTALDTWNSRWCEQASLRFVTIKWCNIQLNIITFICMFILIHFAVACVQIYIEWEGHLCSCSVKHVTKYFLCSVDLVSYIIFVMQHNMYKSKGVNSTDCSGQLCKLSQLIQDSGNCSF